VNTYAAVTITGILSTILLPIQARDALLAVKHASTQLLKY